MLSNTGINKVILLGTAKGPFRETTDRGQDFLCFNLVTTEYIKKGYEQTEHHEYHKIRVPEKLIAQDSLHLAEGQSLFIEGKIQTASYYDEQRVKRYSLEVVANRIDILSTIDINVLK
ncbi:single-stranded DNA-binding protein [Mucilaginibacter sp. ZT4R22]|uniref:Single-stranded DNA-binding protein n=1 Tax=Mucilaginibacter pankratovii TaxID=2772110 RepID=A0ABR7WXT4_9SPHI|nr:single-stranded DNA-binding protein [Mucilaginibacter pankratovii]MBD1367089.1 single-stranded DNA-binding protein [Mucilaginibacter pankratovii]